MAYTQRDQAYPNNYFDYIHSVDADMVLLNCHISLLEKLDGEDLLLVYPSAALKQEYLKDMRCGVITKPISTAWKRPLTRWWRLFRTAHTGNMKSKILASIYKIS